MLQINFESFFLLLFVTFKYISNIVGLKMVSKKLIIYKSKKETYFCNDLYLLEAALNMFCQNFKFILFRINYTFILNKI